MSFPSISSRLLGPSLGLLLSATGCSRGSTEARRDASVAASVPSPAPSPSVPEAVSAPSASVAVPTLASCKAFGQKKQLALGTHSGQLTGSSLVSHGDQLFFLVTRTALARLSLLRLPRQGGTPAVVGGLRGVGEAEHLRISGDMAYFAHKRDTYRLPLAGGEATKIISGTSGSVAFHKDAILSLRCPKSGRLDQLLETRLDGNGERVLVEFDRGHGGCDYRALVVVGERAFVADWEGRLVRAFSLVDGTTSVPVTGHAFLRDLVVGEGCLDFSSSRGLSRLPLDGTKATSLADVPTTPFSDLAHDASDYFLFQGEPYQPTESLWRVARSDGKAQKLWTYNNRGAEEGTGLDAVAVDDQCVYFTQTSPNGDYFTVFARHKPTLPL